MKRVRCAIYTRKSSEEGLEQAFNSLDAQREACAAYILSQASEGWVEIADMYDDGGLSGGSLERPALKRLLGDVAAGRIDIIVVYKVDRLTRSLLDFAKLVEAFDASRVSFVSVTQSFNTTTSMGRLTLNMLLSFAQFEREVTAERIRDKIAASKAKGMWMGGVPPLGYLPSGRTLIIDEAQAEVVRHIFSRYLELGSVRLLEGDLIHQKVRVPTRTTIGGKPLGGGVFTRGQLYQILKNVTYAGLIGHKELTYPGQHPAIIDPAMFERVQQILATNLNGTRTARQSNAQAHLLAGKVVDAAGAPLVTAHTAKPVSSAVERPVSSRVQRPVRASADAGTVRYRYYVSGSLHHGQTSTGVRIPARELDGAVAECVALAFDDPVQLAAAAWLAVPADRFDSYNDRCLAIAGASRGRQPDVLVPLIAQVRVHDDRVEVDCDAAAIATALKVSLAGDAPPIMTVGVAMRLTRSGRVMRLVQADGSTANARHDPSMIRLLVRARSWWAELRTGTIDITRLAQKEGVTRSYIKRVVRLAFLAPSVTEAILSGKQALPFSATSIVAPGAFDASWRSQERQLLRR